MGLLGPLQTGVATTAATTTRALTHSVRHATNAVVRNMESAPMVFAYQGGVYSGVSMEASGLSTMPSMGYGSRGVGRSGVVAEYGGGKPLKNTANSNGSPILYQFQFKTANIKTSDLQPTHGINYSKKAFEKFVVQIQREGIQDPIRYVVHDGVKHVVDGHHRLFAARKLNLPSVPTVEVRLPYKGYKTVNDLVFGL